MLKIASFMNIYYFLKISNKSIFFINYFKDYAFFECCTTLINIKAKYCF